MTARRQHGIALLAMTIVLAILGALSYALASGGAMSAHAVATQYDAEAAGYLAAAGVNVARWRDQQLGCKKGTTTLPATALAGVGSYAVLVTGKTKTADLTGTGTVVGGASATRTRADAISHENTVRTMTLSGGKDSYLDSATPSTPHNTDKFIELTTGSENAVLIWGWPAELNDAVIVKAELTMIQYQSGSTQAGQQIGVYRVTSDWDEPAVTWLTAKPGLPWTSAGGNYAGTLYTAQTILANGTYVWDVTNLATDWATGRYAYFGLFLKAAGPVLQARFYSFQASGSSVPTLVVSYYRKC